MKCHVTSPAAVEKGLRSIAPDQRDVGDRLRAEQIVESLLFPNKVIAKGYDSFVVVTDDGKVHKGVLVSQSAAEIVLVDPEKSAPTRIGRTNIDAMRKSRSAMPDGVADQLANRLDFLDLIRFLVERKTPSTGTPLWRSKLFWSKKSPPVKVAYQS